MKDPGLLYRKIWRAIRRLSDEERTTLAFQILAVNMEMTESSVFTGLTVFGPPDADPIRVFLAAALGEKAEVLEEAVERLIKEKGWMPKEPLAPDPYDEEERAYRG